eukprot:1150718-Amphidinium_carterae.1
MSDELGRAEISEATSGLLSDGGPPQVWLGGSTYSTGPQEADLALGCQALLATASGSALVVAPSLLWCGGAGDRLLLPAVVALSTPVPSLTRYGDAWGEAGLPCLRPGTASPGHAATPVPSPIGYGDVKGERPNLRGQAPLKPQSPPGQGMETSRGRRPSHQVYVVPQ